MGRGEVVAFPGRANMPMPKGLQQIAIPLQGIQEVLTPLKIIQGRCPHPQAVTFSCNVGFTKDTAGRACNFPFPGKYADAQGR